MRKKPPQAPPWVTGGDDVTVPDSDPEAKTSKARRMRLPKDVVRSDKGYTESAAGEKKCNAKKPDGGRCGLSAGFGTDHPGYGTCKWHLGSVPEGRKSAANEMAVELMAFYGQPLDTDPITALLDEVKRTAGHVQWLGERIAQMQAPTFEMILDEEGKPLMEKGKVVTKTAGIPPEVDGWLRTYQFERSHLVKTAKACLDAGVNQRLVDLAEYAGEKLADALELILTGLQLTAAQQARVPQVVPVILRQLASNQPLVLEGVLDD